ncbi:hypothetical protein ACHAPI_010415 [Fusarium lateritium]
MAQQGLISREGIPRNGGVSVVPWAPVSATGGFIVKGKYRFYGSEATDPSHDDAQTLDAGSNIDNFANRLPGHSITLNTVPIGNNEDDVQFDDSDGLATWMTNLDPKGTFKLTLKKSPDPSKGPWDIIAFNFQLTSPWNAVFSSAEEALRFSFESLFQVPVPGLEPDGAMLYFGLDAEKTPQDLSSTIKELFDFSGSLLKPNSIIADWKVALKLQSKESKGASEKSNEDIGAGGKRNGLWISPSKSLQTIVRLQFSLGETDRNTFNDIIGKPLKGLALESLDAVCKKTLVLTETNSGNKAVSQGQVMFVAQCKIASDGKEVPVVASIEFYAFNYNIIIQLNSKDAFQGILLWLTSLVPGLDLKFISTFLLENDIFKDKGVYPRQITVTLDCDSEGKNTKLASFSFDIEVKAGFGQTPPEQPGASATTPVFLISYSWSRGGPKWGSLQGRLWNWFDVSPLRDMQPEYEITSNLTPLTENPATVLNLLTMIPDMEIRNVPATIPTQISRAYIVLGNNGVALGGTVNSKAFDVVDPPPVPQLDLGVISIDASFAWKGQTRFKLTAAFMAEMRPSPTSVHQETAVLKGGVDYDSTKSTWLLKASLDSLYASTLYEFFNKSAADHVMPLIESIAVQSLDLTYHYAPVEVEPSEEKEKKVTKVMGSQFEFNGVLLAAGLELGLNFNYEPTGTFTFKATLSSSKKSATVGDVIKAILGDEGLELPNFLDEITFGKDGKDAIVIEVDKHIDTERKDPKPDEKLEPAVVKLAETKKGSFQFVATVNIDRLSFSFVQIHRLEWAPGTPSKRFFKAALTAVPEIDIPLVGNLTQPFQEMYFMWIQDDTKLNKGGDAGLTRKDHDSLEKTLPLTVKDTFKPPTTDDDLLMSAGSHFGVIIKDSEGKSSCILDYDFKKKASSSPEKQKGGSKALTASSFAAVAADEKEPEKKPSKDDSDGGSASAPFKKKAGPLSISNISLKYVENILRIGFNATFELGPLSFSLLGFTINLKLTSLDLSKIEFPEFSLEGFSVAFDRPPLTIAGIVRRGDTEGLTYYSGGLIVGWVPYQLQAAGFYGEAHPVKDDKKRDFVSVFVFARLDGPLVTLEFAEISGVTGGFGYKSEVRVPKAGEITDFPFINQSQLDGSSGDVLKTLEALTNPDAAAGGWFSPQDDSYWAAAGMRIDAFQMISLDAVMVVMFGQSIKLGIYAVALVDIPNPKSPVKFAHVELGIGVTVDFGYGTMKTEGQLSPKSFILDPNCHLTGGFALYYWFDAPHSDQSNVGNFVFTLGGYHQAFRIPVGWPNPPRLGISWSLGKNLSISGEAYFAITPKVCMGGGRLHAAFSAGPISAWFDAFANFLINYKPFSFNANAGVCVGVRFDIDFLFIHTHISVEISADLYLWGPPLAGRVHVDIKVAKFDINFGSSKSSDPAIDMLAFYDLVLQAGSQKTKSVAAEEEEETSLVAEADKDVIIQPMNQGHTLLVTSGLLNNDASPERSQNADWVVRGGSFAFVIGCKMAAQDALLVDENDKTLNSVSNKGDWIYAKPMHLGKETPMTKSEVKIEIIQNGVSHGAIWGMTQQYKQVPSGLWGPYSEEGDPTKSRDSNNIDDLLDDNKGSVKLMMGVLMQGPPAVMSEDTLEAFDILDAGLEDLPADKNFPDPGWSDKSWEPDEPKKSASQWDVVHNKWKSPDWNEGEARDVQTSFVDTWANTFGWDAALSGFAKIPKLLDERFNNLYIGAPLTTK